MIQLKLTRKQLLRIGFTKKTYPADEMNSKQTTYEIETINGCFYYNITNDKYRWYHKTIIGNHSNHIHLNIKKLPELFMVLACFQVNYFELQRRK